MATSNKLDVEVEVRVWDTEETSQSENGRDEYTLVVRNGSVAYSACFYRERPRPLEIAIRSEQLALDEIPPRAASVMQDHIDDSVIAWPTTFDAPQGEIDRKEVIVTVTESEENDEGEIIDETKYRFNVYDDHFVEASSEGSRIDQHAVPTRFMSEAEQYIPPDIDYIGT